MNNGDRIRAMGNEELAEFLLKSIPVEDYPTFYFETSDGMQFDGFDKERALLHEIKWLESEVEVE